MTPWAPKWRACWLEPHWRSMVVAGTDSGYPAARTALRPTLSDCSPTCMTQPIPPSPSQRSMSLTRPVIPETVAPGWYGHAVAPADPSR